MGFTVSFPFKFQFGVDLLLNRRGKGVRLRKQHSFSALTLQMGDTHRCGPREIRETGLGTSLADEEEQILTCSSLSAHLWSSLAASPDTLLLAYRSFFCPLK